MIAAFWHAVGGKLADRWATVSAPALVFWLAGLAAWSYRRGGLHTLTGPNRWLDRQTTAAQILAILIGLLIVATSVIIVSWWTTPVLRLLEGYWPTWASPVSRWLTGRLVRRAEAEEPEWQAAYDAVQPSKTPTAGQLAAYARLERRRRRRPTAARYFLPTPIGNILRAAERRPIDKYGLDAVALWPRLWLLLPDATRRQLLSARASLDSAVTTAIWGVSFCAFTPYTILAIPIGLSVAALAITVVVPGRAQVFGDLIEAAYDLHRTALYQQLRWPLPANPKQEHAAGERLTSYLRRGSHDPDPTFTSPYSTPDGVARDWQSPESVDTSG